MRKKAAVAGAQKLIHFFSVVPASCLSAQEAIYGGINEKLL